MSTTTTVKAIAVRAGWSASAVVSRTYTMNFGVLVAPTIAPAAGTYESSITTTLTSVPGSTIRYTTDGSTPSAGSPLYSGPVTLTQTGTVKAIAMHPDYTASAVTSAAYTIEVAAPTITPGAGTYADGQPLLVVTATPGATIHYTLHGGDPTESDPVGRFRRIADHRHLHPQGSGLEVRLRAQRDHNRGVRRYG